MKFVYYEINYLFLYLQLLKDFFKVFEYLKYEIKKKKKKKGLINVKDENNKMGLKFQNLCYSLLVIYLSYTKC